MKTSYVLLCGMFLLGVSCTSPRTTTLPDCPLGHRALKLTTVEYGKLLMTPELQERMENKDTLAGGCVVGSVGRFGVICTTCGLFTFDGDDCWYESEKEFFSQHPVCSSLEASPVLPISLWKRHCMPKRKDVFLRTIDVKWRAWLEEPVTFGCNGIELRRLFEPDGSLSNDQVRVDDVAGRTHIGVDSSGLPRRDVLEFLAWKYNLNIEWDQAGTGNRAIKIRHNKAIDRDKK